MKEDISSILVQLPEEWSRSKKQYARLSIGGDESKEPVWLGRKYDFSSNGNKARVEYTDADIAKIDQAPDGSVVQVRNNKGVFRFQKKNGKWQLIPEA